MTESENKIYDSANENQLQNTIDVNTDSTEMIQNTTNEDKLFEDKSNTNNEALTENIIDTNTDGENKIENNINVNSNNTNIEIEIAEALDVYNILTIDDDKWIQRIFSQYLSQWGFHNISAMDPYTGLEEAIKNKPLIIFLDILLPEVNGDMLIKFLKKMEFTANIPVVIISGNLSKEIIKSTYLAGAAGFITKPFTQDTLFNKIKEVINPGIFNRLIKDGKINTAQIKKKPHLGV